MVNFDGVDVENPNPNIHDLFSYYNQIYFSGKLGACSLKWSTKRMTLCAGVCHYSTVGGCDIRLSEPLLKFRPVSDLKNTLLHEMIHAYLFLTDGNKDHDDHGPCFQHMMMLINNCRLPDEERPDGGYAITVYHQFNDEVDLYRVHQWRCTNCADLIKRAMNRTPSVSDCISRSGACSNARCHWHIHKKQCGGSYEKIHEPADYVDKRKGSAIQGKGKHNSQFIGEGGADLTHSGKKRKSIISEGVNSNQGNKGPVLHVKIANLEKYFCTVEQNEDMITHHKKAIFDKDIIKDCKPSEAVSVSPVKHFSIVEMDGEQLQNAMRQRGSKIEKIEEVKSLNIDSHFSAVKDGRSLLKQPVIAEKQGSGDKTANLDVRDILSSSRISVRLNQENEVIHSKVFIDNIVKETSQIHLSGRKKGNTADKVLGNQVHKEPLVIMAWANWVSYESDEESEEPLTNKRTERRKQDRTLELLYKGKTLLDQSGTETQLVAPEKFPSNSESLLETSYDSLFENKLQKKNVDQFDEEISEKILVTDIGNVFLIELSDDEDIADQRGGPQGCMEDEIQGTHLLSQDQGLSDMRDLTTKEPSQGGFVENYRREPSKRSGGKNLSALGKRLCISRESTTETDTITCPICCLVFPGNEHNKVINNHIDKCLENSL